MKTGKKGNRKEWKRKLAGKALAALALAACITGLAGAGGSRAEAAEKNGFTYYVKKDYCVITKYQGTKTSVTIPKTLGGKKKIYMEIKEISGKNGQVRKIHLSKNVLGINGDPKKYHYSPPDDVYAPVSLEDLALPEWEEITVEKSNPKYCSEDGCLYSRDMKNLEIIPPRKTGKFVVRDSVESIRFYPANSRITSMKFGKNMDGAYLNCLSMHKKLKSISASTKNKRIKIKDNVVYSRDGKKIYGSCRKKGKYKMPSTVTRVDEYAFAGSGLEEVVLSRRLERVPSYLFAYCKDLKKVTYGERTSEICYGAFYESGLETLKLPEGVRSIDLRIQTFQKIESAGKKIVLVYEEGDSITYPSERAKVVAEIYDVEIQTGKE